MAVGNKADSIDGWGPMNTAQPSKPAHMPDGIPSEQKSNTFDPIESSENKKPQEIPKHFYNEATKKEIDEDENENDENENKQNEDNKDETKDERPEDIDLAKRFNAITKREKALRDREAALKAQAEEIETKTQSLSKIKDDPVGFLTEHGLEFKDLAERILNDDKPTVEQKLARLEELFEADKKERKEREERLKAEREARKKAHFEERETQALQQLNNSVKKTLDEHADDYELINFHGSQQLVVDTIVNVFRETGKIIDITHAADEVEKYLDEQSSSIFKTKKFKTRYKKIEADQDEVKPQPSNYYHQKLMEERYGRGLSNDFHGDSSTSKKPQNYLSDDEAKYRLAKKLQSMIDAGQN